MSLFLVGTGVIATPPDGAEWVPPECDVSIRPGWFYRASEDKRVTDLAALSGMRERLDRVYGRDLAAGGTVVTAGRTTTLRLPALASFDRVVVQEDIRGGQHIAGFVIEAESDGDWRRVATGSTVAYKRILPVPHAAASAVRVAVLDAHGTPRISRVSLHRAE